MIQDFSEGYYQTSMNIHEYDRGPSMDKYFYKFINSELFQTKDEPVLMRVGLDEGPLFEVKPENGIPRDVLALPPELCSVTGEESVFVLKPEYTDSIGEYHG